MNIIEFVCGKRYLADGQISAGQRAILKAIYGLPMEGEEETAFLAMSGGMKPRAGGYTQASLGCGRRSGKTEKIAANIAAFEAVTFDPKILAPGEYAYVVLVAQNRKAARICRDYIEAKFLALEERGWQVLEKTSGQMKSITAEEIRLRNKVIVATFPCKKVSVRGITCVCAVMDEIGHWQVEEDAYNADVEVLRAIRPAMATLRGRAKLVKISTPFLEAGVFYDDYKKRGKPGDQLILHEVPTELLNPSISRAFLAMEQRDDPASYAREYLARWSGVGGGFISGEMVDACVVPGVTRVPPQPGRHYISAVDVAFKRDLFAFGIAHEEDGKVRIDVLTHWKPTGRKEIDLDEVVDATSDLAKSYGVDTILSDQYADVPMRKAYEQRSIRLREIPLTHLSKYEMFKNLRAVLQGKLIELPQDAVMRRDLTSLRAVKMPGGFYRIAAPELKGYHDDLSIVLARLTMELLNLLGAGGIYELNERRRLEAEKLGWKFPEREEDERSFERDIMGAVL